LLGFALVALTVPAAARAQTATPVAPAAEECTIAPISVERLAGILATPVARNGLESEASPTPIVIPEGKPADDATTAAIEAAAREFIACLNGGDLHKVLAFYSDNAISTLVIPEFGVDATAQNIFDRLAGGQPAAEGSQTVFYGVEQVLNLPDGRVASLVIGDDLSKPGPAGPALVYWVKVDGQWLVDDFISSEKLAGTGS
jgi:hypothetical protein